MWLFSRLSGLKIRFDRAGGGQGNHRENFVIGIGIVALALLIFPVRRALPDSQIASQSVSTIQMTERACVISGIEAAGRISAQEAALEVLGEKN